MSSSSSIPKPVLPPLSFKHSDPGKNIQNILRLIREEGKENPGIFYVNYLRNSFLPGKKSAFKITVVITVFHLHQK